ncbi:MAG: 4-phosphoerythronate dehydrogenase [Candidatus Hydrogenedens sp.]|nr:4-phosphoerythronate dehydrogenase [Candidatus Hydrogenedens sp.]
MKIVVDENIPYGQEAFGTLGSVQLSAGRAVSPSMLSNADALIVRSITRVDEALLTGSAVRFVGTCTIGEDHIDKEWLSKEGIAFSSAPGCNATSVADYMTAALLLLEKEYNLSLDQMSLGVVGVGNVGSRVAAKAQALGMHCVLNDPPLAEKTGDSLYRPMEEIHDCDIITFHTPLIRDGRWPTWHLADENFFEKLRPGTILLNTARGAVVDNMLLKEKLVAKKIRAAVLDVWENEPTIDQDLLKLVFFGTPHIAGYSFDGKVNGTTQIYEALCAHAGRASRWAASKVMPPPPCPEVTVDPDEEHSLLKAVTGVYDFPGDDRRMREILDLPPDQVGPHFDLLLKQYPVRRDFHNTRAVLKSPSEKLARSLSGIGFAVV